MAREGIDALTARTEPGRAERGPPDDVVGSELGQGGNGPQLRAIVSRREQRAALLDRNERASRLAFVAAAISFLIGSAIFASARLFGNVCFFPPYDRYCVFDGRNYLLVGTSIAVILVGIGASKRVRAMRQEIVDLDNEADLLRIGSQSHEHKAQKLLRIQQLELKRFYDQTLRQSSMIFAVGVATMALGFAIIVATLYFVGGESLAPDGSLQDRGVLGEKVVVAVLGAVGGILTNFVGAMYIKMFSEIVQSVARSQSAVVATHHLHLANLLAATIGDDALRQKTLADLALALRPSAPSP